MKKNNLPESDFNLSRVIILLLIVNALGYLLRYYGLDTYIIIIGFRFHLSFVLPLIILLPRGYLTNLKQVTINPIFSRKFIPVLWVLIPAAVVLAGLYLFNKAELGDPEYFYEFGLSSIFDYPLYLAWNFPQFLLLFLFLYLVVKKYRNRFLPVLILIFFLFIYELVPLDFKEPLHINYYSAADLLLMSICGAFLIQFYNNVYWFTIIMFSTLWFSLLAFGSKSATMINMLFAAQYTEWEGFFIVSEALQPYLLAAQVTILFILLICFLPIRVKEMLQSETAYEIKQTEIHISS